MAVLERVGATENRQYDLPVLAAVSERAAQLWMAPEHVRARNQLAGDAGCESWKLVVQEGGKAIEISERVCRPLDLYGPGHGRNPGLPHVRSHCTTRSVPP